MCVAKFEKYKWQSGHCFLLRGFHESLGDWGSVGPDKRGAAIALATLPPAEAGGDATDETLGDDDSGVFKPWCTVLEVMAICLSLRHGEAPGVVLATEPSDAADTEPTSEGGLVSGCIDTLGV